MKRTKVKICGVRHPETLALLAELDVDYAGLVFAPSKRQITPLAARQLQTAVPHHPPLVGVFVNPTVAEIADTLAAARLDVLQLHGQEPPVFLAELRSCFPQPLWKALPVRHPAQMREQVRAYLPYVDAILLDTHDPLLAGGTGRSFCWEYIPALQEMAGDTPVIVAGGITAENLSELLADYRPAAIDLSSGAETAGEKDPEKIKRIMKRVVEHGQTGANNSSRA